MSTKEREFDLIVFGATGYTGQYVVETLAKSEEAAKYRWAVAGRNRLKLRKTLDDVGMLVGLHCILTMCACTPNSAPLREKSSYDDNN